MLCCLTALANICRISSLLTRRPSIRLVTMRTYLIMPASNLRPSSARSCLASFGGLPEINFALLLVRLPFCIFFLNFPSLVL